MGKSRGAGRRLPAHDTPSLVISAISVRDSGRFVLCAQAACGFCGQSVPSLVTNAAFRWPPIVAQRRRSDCAFHGPELRSVELTAAFSDNSLLRAVDATAASFGEGELTAVETPPQVATRFPSRKWDSRLVFRTVY